MTGDTVGGVWSYALELAQALSEHRTEIVLATMGPLPSDKQRARLRDLANVTLYAADYRLEWMENPWRDVDAAGAWLLKLESRFEPDIVHLNGFSHGALPWRVPCLIVGHSCVWSWFEAVKGVAPPTEWNEYKNRVTAGLRAAQIVTAPSRAMLEALCRHYGPFAATGPVYNGRNPRHYAPGRKEPFVLAAGRFWDEAKNIGALAPAAQALPWRIYAAGPDQAPDGNKPRRDDSLIFLGEVDSTELSSWLARAAIFVLPARYEPFGLSVLEAALAGCALVLGDIPSLRELWDGAAVFVPPNDSHAISDGLKRLIEDSTGRRKLADTARRRAAFFSPERMARGYLDLYARLVESGEQVPAPQPTTLGNRP
ncbi:MAG TPA: glycosyltransferase family 4 protein [Candidatus Eisenbacteria bacterium]|nr:glycosyltransferase family 4 protein [Candidatus Eisenbacteria bacterium]